MAFHLRYWAALIALAPVPAFGQAPEAMDGAKKKPVWVMNQGDLRCTLMRTMEGPEPITFGIRIVPGAQSFDMFIINPAWKSNPLEGTGHFDLRFEAKPVRLFGDNATAMQLDGKDHFAVFAPRVPIDALKNFDGIRTIRASLGKDQSVDLNVAGAAKAVAALRQCIDRQLMDWGADPKIQESLKSMPVGETLRLFHPNDYPESSLRKGSSGQVIVAYTIGPSGRIDECKVVGPSGDPALDLRTCEVMKERGKFEPAIGADGKPTRVTMVLPVTWVIP